ncbi:acyl-CoA dehydrogenase family protein [Allonocardiopsis opalescens]|uniref:Alkylation response protein AidB-like acyl-CoA dehydrogenase n=1 Tax=Allonocardiopsis opalescens TaxID=1144618 RepID=A0A2T0PS68_9ACTN|nr:acyl-CoA dehydrogenase family protein [Allonocardiopsis opalescens]PRX91724.1 alkylation response protein AidB-like acyl-CoA dehydrogenase [Allonocardiopsis opalescens]
MPEYLDALETVIADVVASDAPEVDKEGRFPERGVSALKAAGILGLTTSPDVGGGGGSLRDAARVIERLAGNCGSTAMVVLMHYAATAVIEAHGPKDVREAIASGGHLTTLAFSEAGSRSHFWAPGGSATADGGDIVLNAAKSWVTSAGAADSYVWSSRPVAAPGPMTLWLVPARTPGVQVAGPFDGLGLRGNDSRPVRGTGVRIPATARLGEDGAGLDIALAAALPWFLVLNAAFSVGLCEAAVAEATRHATATRLEHLGQTLAQQPVTRDELARLRNATDTARAFLADTLDALEQSRPDATLRVLQVKAVAGETASEVTDQALRLGGGAAFRKELGVERRFRDARAARVMAPTTSALRDFVGRAITGQPLFDEPAGEQA